MEYSSTEFFSGKQSSFYVWQTQNNLTNSEWTSLKMKKFNAVPLGSVTITARRSSSGSNWNWSLFSIHRNLAYSKRGRNMMVWSSSEFFRVSYSSSESNYLVCSSEFIEVLFEGPFEFAASSKFNFGVSKLSNRFLNRNRIRITSTRTLSSFFLGVRFVVQESRWEFKFNWFAEFASSKRTPIKQLMNTKRT